MVVPCTEEDFPVTDCSQAVSAFDFSRIVTEGGDDRVLLNSKGINKYFCPVIPEPASLFRGSCTCNIPTGEAYHAAKAAYCSLTAGEVIFAAPGSISFTLK